MKTGAKTAAKAAPPKKTQTKSISGVQPSVLRWARESQGYSQEDVALHLKRTTEEVAAWEAGSSAPTYAQLETLAYGLFKRPLAVFFLPAPPPEPKVKQEFRTLPDFEIDQLAADTRYQLRLAHAYQISLRELNDGANTSPRKIFSDLRFSDRTGAAAAAATVRQYLGTTVATQTAWGSSEDALKAWRGLVEDVGVYVFKHAFKQKAISGFCLADDQFPIIYLNNSTAKTRQIFSLFHELAHLLLKVNAISKFDESYIEFLPPREQRIERFCNAFAAEFLIPSSDFSSQIDKFRAINEQTIQALARRYLVSREAILRRILDRGLVNQKFYEELVAKWNDESESSSRSSNEGGGGDYFATQSTYLGDRYLQLVFSKHYQGRISLEQVADYLGVRTKSVAGIEAMLLRKAVPV